MAADFSTPSLRIAPWRAYVDTSVFGGCFDTEFQQASRRFFERVSTGEFIILLGDTTIKELRRAPDEVQGMLRGLPPETVEHCPVSDESAALANAYLEERIVGPKWRGDALHVATATIYRADVLLSWNFRHIVHWQKIDLFNRVNERLGYSPLRIHSPLEVQSA